jgi:hypothetical protein
MADRMQKVECVDRDALSTRSEKVVRKAKMFQSCGCVILTEQSNYERA